MKWKFIDLRSGWDIQIVTTEEERDRFARHCENQRIRYGLIRVDEDGITKEGICENCRRVPKADQGPA